MAGERQLLHQGIVERDFELAFKLSLYWGAGRLLTINLARELPEALKPRAIPIGKSELLALPG